MTTPSKDHAVRLAIADPPYLGRAELWYGGKGSSKQGTTGHARGRGDLSPEYHPDAAKWDDPLEHIALISLTDDLDQWMMFNNFTDELFTQLPATTHHQPLPTQLNMPTVQPKLAIETFPLAEMRLGNINLEAG